MRKLILSSAIVMAMGTASVAGHAAESAALSVTGTIDPATCDVTLSAASIDMGTISMANLTDTSNSKEGSDITVNVGCDAPAAIAVQATDNRTSSAMTTAEVLDDLGQTFPGLTDANFFGLGTDTAGNKTGVLMLAITDATLDGTANVNMLSSTDKVTWTAKAVSSTTGLNVVKDGYFASAADADATSPAAVTNATYTVSSGVFLKNSSMYPTGENVELDGNVTFSIVYL